MMRSAEDHDAIEDQLVELVGTSEYGVLSSEARILTKELLAEGYDRGQLIDAYKLVVARLYNEDRGGVAEELLEVMTELEGRCSPHARL